MARAPRDPRLRLDQPGQRPILQGHLRRGGRPTPAQPPETTAPPAPEEQAAEPANEGAAGQKTATKGKATRSPAKVAAKRSLAGSEGGPV